MPKLIHLSAKRPNRIGRQQQQHHGRKLFLSAILDFFFGFLSGFKTCRPVSDTQLETSEGKNILSYLFAIIFGGENAGKCSDGDCSEFCNHQSCRIDYEFEGGTCTCLGGGGTVVQCTIPNTVCQNDQCECQNGFQGDPSTGCEPPAPGTSNAGQVCTSDETCNGASVCRSGVCLATEDCNLLKHKAGDPFDQDRINLIVVGSMFDNDQQFVDAVNNLYERTKTFEFFDESITLYNFMYVLPSTGQESSFCQQPCNGINRLLCCDIPTANRLASRCIATNTPNVQKLVLHNSGQYGGAGYTSSNMATATIHPVADLIMVHELGHSLLNLGDEYEEAFSTASFSANCATAGCDKWSDLIGNTPSGYTPVGCVSGVCSNGNFYAGERSFMDELTFPIGAVNARFACCTYLTYTKSIPAYCNKFEFSSGALLSYCRDNDYQFYGEDSYTRQAGRLQSSTLFTISIPMEGANPTVTWSPTTSTPRSNWGVLFFPSLEDASGRVFILEYKIIGTSGVMQQLVSATNDVHVPLPSTGSDDGLIADEDMRVESNFVQVEIEIASIDIEFATVEIVEVA